MSNSLFEKILDPKNKSMDFKGKPIGKYVVEKLANKISDTVISHLEDIVTIKNLRHGTDENSKYIRQWEAYMKHKADHCINLGCTNKKAHPALVGAHVIKVDEDDKSWYIAPLCHECNSDDKKEEMQVLGCNLAPYTEIEDLQV